MFGSQKESERERERERERGSESLWEESQSVFLRERAEWRELGSHPQEALDTADPQHVPDRWAEGEEQKAKSEKRKKESVR